MAKRTKATVGIAIRSHPEVQAKAKSSELPFHILFVGDLTPQAKAPSDWSLRSHIHHDVNKQSFAQLMQRLAPRLSIDVPDLIGGNPKLVEFDLQFQDLKAFRPEGIAMQVPSLARLLTLKVLVEQVRIGALPLSEFKGRAEAAGLDPDLAHRFQEVLSAPDVSSSQIPPPSTPSIKNPDTTGEDKLGSLLQMVDLGSGEPAVKKPDAMDALLSAITGNESWSPSGPSTRHDSPAGVEGSVAGVLTADLDHMLGDQVNAVLHHPRFQNLEASWRGLKFLVDRIDFRKNVRLSVLTTSKEHLSDALYHQLLNPPGETRQQLVETPVSVVVADFEFGISPSEVNQLHGIAETMASAQVPFVAGVGPSFFGGKDPSEIAELPVLWQHFERPEYVAWNSLRDRTISTYVSLALPRFLLRFPYGPDNPVKEFRFVESSGNPAQRGKAAESTTFLWGNPAVAIATTMARSFAHSGWPTHITGSHDGGRVEDLPLWQPFSHASSKRIPLDVSIPDDKQAELSEMGFAVLACRPNDDAAYFAFAPSIHRPEHYDDPDSNEDARMHATLACQLMVTRILHHLLRFERELPPHLSPSVVEGELMETLRSLLKANGMRLPQKGIEVGITEPAGTTNRLPLRIHLITPPEILGREVSIVMGFELTLK